MILFIKYRHLIKIFLRIPKRIKNINNQMMDMTSLQSIQEQLSQPQFQSVFQKSQYMQNLKSECVFKQNALITAQNLIEEYHRQNQQLKLQVLRLNQKIQHYDERIQILRQQVELKDISNAKTYQKQLFKSSYKLSKILEKYSDLQQKYHALEKELIKYKFYKQQNEEMILKQQRQKQKRMKIAIQKQFNNFLRTPVNKPLNSFTNMSTSKKQYVSKQKKIKNLKLEDFQSEQKDNNHMKFVYDSSSDECKRSIHANDITINNKNSIKKSAEKIHKMYQQQIKSNYKCTQQENAVFQKLKILQWKLKQKDQQIMLMLRRNKEIEGKYSVLKQILSKHHQSNNDSSDESINKKKKSMQKLKRNYSSQSKPTQKINTLNENQFHETNDIKNVQTQKINDRKITHFSTSLNNSTDNSTWKNYQSFKLH